MPATTSELKYWEQSVFAVWNEQQRPPMFPLKQKKMDGRSFLLLFFFFAIDRSSHREVMELVRESFLVYSWC